MVCCPVSRARAAAGDGLPLLSHVKVHRDNEEPRAGGFPLIWFSCATECAGTPGPFNGPFDSAVGLGTMGGEASGACGRRCRLEQTPIFNLCPVEPKTEDHSAVSAGSESDLPKPALHALLTGRNLQNTEQREMTRFEIRHILDVLATGPGAKLLLAQ